uniref:G_PROTEIN_RECEP_F1_2 domain-containing protein n=1 Tax=Caenorhabditis tropicalis TaxID=1561998 RepID=A0A1I7V3Z7_9PELO
MTSETAFSYEDVIAGSIVSVICAIGTGLMTLVIIGSSRIPSMKSSFGMLTINQNLAQLVACVACFIVFFFGVTLGIETVIDYGYIIGGITVVMLYVILVSFFIISFNRLCAIAFPIAYNFMFKEKFLFGILAVGWLTPFAYGMYLLVYRQCAYVFLHHGWYFDELKNEKCGAQLAMYVAGQTVPVLATVLTDLLTLTLLITLRNDCLHLQYGISDMDFRGEPES